MENKENPAGHKPAENKNEEKAPEADRDKKPPIQSWDPFTHTSSPDKPYDSFDEEIYPI
ncbi:MAG: hypothetical protein ABIT47_03715 [Candidatus Paceibacterota bacterium]